MNSKRKSIEKVNLQFEATHSNSTFKTLILALIQIGVFVAFMVLLNIMKSYLPSLKFISYWLMGIAYLLTATIIFVKYIYETFPLNMILLILNAALISCAFGPLLYISSLLWTCIFLSADGVIMVTLLIVGAKAKLSSKTMLLIFIFAMLIAVIVICIIAAVKQTSWINENSIGSSVALLAVLLLILEGNNLSTDGMAYALASLLIFTTYIYVYYSMFLLSFKYLNERGPSTPTYY
ncbi:unnamed protein product [Heterobilharzia americana]|nr:unnamed protein product [Heterobilharzia americana]